MSTLTYVIPSNGQKPARVRYTGKKQQKTPSRWTAELRERALSLAVVVTAATALLVTVL